MSFRRDETGLSATHEGAIERQKYRAIERRDLHLYRHVRHKAIAMPALRLDNALRLAAVTHRKTHGAQAALQGGVTDREPLPNLVAQFLLGDHAVTMFDEIAEHLEDLGSQPSTLACPVQSIELRVQDTIYKVVDHASSAERR
jgi:hypothetical protein